MCVVRETDQKAPKDAIQSQGKPLWDKSSLTEVDSTNDHLEQYRSCRKCVIPRTIFNAKAGDDSLKSEQHIKYRLDLYDCYKTNPRYFDISHKLLGDFGISLNVTILRNLLDVLADKDWAIAIKELELGWLEE
eukprot:gb/GECG01006776.1/.p1 GENE.gb/GECG01006776.1/~~gb/GECG01006776.1/.p1  ORF type:complete len:133 (+),score=11.78 gb/GECG01006776.1/:1-399(+)